MNHLGCPVLQFLRHTTVDCCWMYDCRCCRWTISVTSITSTCTELIFLNLLPHLNSYRLSTVSMLESCRTSTHWAFTRRLLLKCRPSPSCYTYVLFIPIIQCVCLSLIPIVPHVCLSYSHHATCTPMSCLFPLCYMCAFTIPIIIIIIIRQLIRRCNMSMKSLQMRRTAYATRIKLIKMRVHNMTAKTNES